MPVSIVAVAIVNQIRDLNFSSTVESPATNDVPQAARERLREAEMRFTAGDYAESIALYNQATTLGLDTTETQWDHCNKLAEQGQSESALTVCGLVAGVADPSDASDVIIAGSHLTQGGEHARALTLLNQVERIEPDHVSLPWPKAMALNGLNRYEEALSTADIGLSRIQGLGLPDAEALLLVEKGNAVLGLGDPDQAMSFATEALVLSPQLPMALALSEKAQQAAQ